MEEEAALSHTVYNTGRSITFCATAKIHGKIWGQPSERKINESYPWERNNKD